MSPKTSTRIPPEIEQPGSEVQAQSLPRSPSRRSSSWAATLISHIAGATDQTPSEGRPSELRHALVTPARAISVRAARSKLRSCVAGGRVARRRCSIFAGWKVCRRAFITAIRSIEIAEAVVGTVEEPAARHCGITLAGAALDEVLRCIRSQSLRTERRRPRWPAGA